MAWAIPVTCFLRFGGRTGYDRVSAEGLWLFRTRSGAERFCRIRGYVLTLRKQRMTIIAALRQAVGGAPFAPATA
ncbi:MAG: hypothetical protein HY675_01150 [Chloroflexi bacterium]|nr:hypothetical protein [Chloroflexota bacterium]